MSIDSEVRASQTVPDRSTPPPACPQPPEGAETLTVPAEGIATPEDSLEELQNTSWIFGHSRWQGRPGVLFAVQDIEVGDELFLDWFDRRTGDEVDAQRFVVDGIYLADKDSGAALVGESPGDSVLVILQTSVRGYGADAGWLLDRARVMAKATNLVEGSLDDPCKYLLLFVVAHAG